MLAYILRLRVLPYMEIPPKTSFLVYSKVMFETIISCLLQAFCLATGNQQCTMKDEW
jgi:hypothetical protein